MVNSTRIWLTSGGWWEKRRRVNVDGGQRWLLPRRAGGFVRGSMVYAGSCTAEQAGARHAGQGGVGWRGGGGGGSDAHLKVALLVDLGDAKLRREGDLRLVKGRLGRNARLCTAAVAAGVDGVPLRILDRRGRVMLDDLGLRATPSVKSR